MNFIVYEKLTGKILKTGFCPNSLLLNQVPDINIHGVFEGVANDTIQYIVSGEIIVNKPINPATITKLTMTANAIDTVTVSNLPNPSSVVLEGVNYTVTDGAFGFTVDTVGIYTIKVMSFPYLDKEFRVNAS